MVRWVILFLVKFWLFGCSSNVKSPVEESIFIVAGQSYPSAKQYYQDRDLPTPSGFSDYISYDVGSSYKSYSPEYPKKYQGNDGLLSATNWGSGIQCLECHFEHDYSAGAIINIGLFMAGPESDSGKMCHKQDYCNAQKIIDGERDDQLRAFSRWAKKHKNNTILLRVGYEFDGAWNAYDPDSFKAAFKYIHDYLEERGVNNIEYVLHSVGYAEYATLEKFYLPPENGKVFVDWIGYSYFTTNHNVVGKHELAFARAQKLPVFLGEVAPHTGECNQQIDVTQDIRLAAEWLDNFMLHLKSNRDVIRGIAYINENWSDPKYSPMWVSQLDQGCGGFFSQSNSQLTESNEFKRLWIKAISDPMFFHPHEK